jgi:hypothetical protein
MFARRVYSVEFSFACEFQLRNTKRLWVILFTDCENIFNTKGWVSTRLSLDTAAITRTEALYILSSARGRVLKFNIVFH